MIERSAAESYLPVIARMLKGEMVSMEQKRQIVENRNPIISSDTNIEVETGNMWTCQFSNEEGERVAVIDLSGVMMKQGDYCSYGTDDILKLINSAGINRNIVSVIIRTNSPGGAADSCEQLFYAIRNFEATYQKPIFNFADSMACSAAVFATAAAPLTIIGGNSTIVGSVGTMMTMYDYTGWFEMNGIKEITVYASQSTEKNADFEEARKGNFKPLQDNLLNPLQRSFEAAVRTGRGDKIKTKFEEKLFAGGLFIGRDAIRAGLADDMMPFNDMVEYAWREGKKRKNKM